MRLPDEVAKLLGASRAHARGITGRGVRVAVVDSGFFPHPYYLSRDYKITYCPTRRDPEPHVDEYGHGTAQLASLFAIAPGAEALAVKCMDRDPSDALEAALALKPDILSCAWGFNVDHEGIGRVPRGLKRLQRLIRRAVEEGICVIASAGNGQRAFPGSMPEVLSVGGVYYAPDGRYSPSDVSSRFVSSIFPGRSVPDVCGLVGKRPHGRLLLVPVPPRARLARRQSFMTIAAGEFSPATGMTAARGPKARGWAMFSGTSAATAMISGAAALLLQLVPDLSPDEIRATLVESSRRIAEGKTTDLLIDIDPALSRQFY